MDFTRDYIELGVDWKAMPMIYFYGVEEGRVRLRYGPGSGTIVPELAPPRVADAAEVRKEQRLSTSR